MSGQTEKKARRHIEVVVAVGEEEESCDVSCRHSKRNRSNLRQERLAVIK